LNADTLPAGAGGIQITLKGSGSERKVSLAKAGEAYTAAEKGLLFTIGKASGTFAVTLVLGENITLQGIGGTGGIGAGVDSNGSPLVRVYAGGTLKVTNASSKIIGNKGGVSGGAVYVDAGGAFEMSAGEISGNTASNSGGGIYVIGPNSTVTLSGGTITANSAQDGGGIYKGASVTLTINGSAAITNNAATRYGGGVFSTGAGTFAIEGNAVIANNSAATYGGGVSLASSSVLTMSGGTIKGNTVTGGTTGGAGVYVASGTSFTKTGGTIYGDTDTTHTENTDENTSIASGKGHAVYHAVSAYYRNTTAGTTDNITASGTGSSAAHAGLSTTGAAPFSTQ
jgi:hypothetical protein